MRAIVIGGSGQIGGSLLQILSDRRHHGEGTYATVPFPGLVRLDASDLPGARAWLLGKSADVVFYPAGFTWVDGCERDPARALASNLEEPRNLALAAREIGARFVYFSTDYVFDGQGGPYFEDDPAHPLSVYGRAKLEAERAIAEILGDRALVIRTTWVFGPERQGKNVAYQVARALYKGQAFDCPSDQVSTPSYGPDVASVAVRLVEQGRSGLVHVAGPDVLDRVTFACAVASAFGLDPALIRGRTTAELRQEAPRPLNGGLRTHLLETWLPGSMRPVDEALADFQIRLSARDPWARPIWQA